MTKMKWIGGAVLALGLLVATSSTSWAQPVAKPQAAATETNNKVVVTFDVLLRQPQIKVEPVTGQGQLQLGVTCFLLSPLIDHVSKFLAASPILPAEEEQEIDEQPQDTDRPLKFDRHFREMLRATQRLDLVPISTDR